MTERDVKIVVAEGASGRKGLLRFVLESEGYNVVGEAATSADLAQALEAYHPDVVVMDDGIGATAVGMTHDLAPAAKVILVWPEAVVPIGGDAAVEPSSVLRQLGPTVERLTGAPSVTGRMGAREGAEAAGIGMLSLGAILAMGRAAASPSEPPVPLDASAALDPAEPVIDDRGATPVLILPPTADVGPDGADLPAAVAGPLTVAELEAAERRAAAPVPTVGAVAGIAAVTAGAATAGAGVAAVGGGGSGAALNRRLGTLALGGAALAGSLVLALALSGSRVPTGGVRGEAPTISSPPPVTSSPTIPPPQTVAVPGALLGDLGGSGTTLALVSTPVAPGSGSRTGNDNGGPRGGTGGNDGNTPTTPPAGTGGSGGGSGSVGSGGGGGGSGGAGDPGGSGGSGGSGSGGSGTGGGSGGSGGGGSFFGGGGGGGGKNGGGECVPVAHDGDGRTDGQPCATDDDELDGSHHGYGDGDHHGDGYQGDDDHQGDGDHDGDDCDGHDGASDHGHDGDDGDHEHDGGDGHGDGGDGHGDDGDGS